MKAILLRTALFAAIVASANALLWTRPIHTEDFILCVAIQTCIPLLAWVSLRTPRVGRGMQTVVTLFWTWLASSFLVALADKFHDSSVYQPPRPWDHLFYEGGILAYLGLVIPIFSIIAMALTIIPFAGETFP